MTDETRDDELFARRVAQPLREPEVLDREFERRVMAAVCAVPAPWWRRPLDVRVTPLRALAMAAAFGGFMVLGTLGVSGWFGSAEVTGTHAVAAGPAVDTVHLVRFVLVAPDAREVALVGDFNAWSRDATTLTPTGSAGVWSVSVPLQPGRHEYAFVVDGEQWVADPTTPRHVDEFGTESSVLRVGSDAVRGV